MTSARTGRTAAAAGRGADAQKTLIDQADIGQYLSFLETEQDLALRLTRIDRQRFAKVVGTDHSPVLSNRNLGCFAELFPDHGKGRLASLAVVPLFLDGGVIGSLNLGDIVQAQAGGLAPWFLWPLLPLFSSLR